MTLYLPAPSQPTLPLVDTIHCCDAFTLLRSLPDRSINCVITSPPYYNLREYGTATWIGGDAECKHVVGNQVADNKYKGAITSGVRPGVDASTCLRCGATRVDHQIGLERTPQQYVEKLVLLFREVRRVLRDEGVFFLNLGDSYAGYWGDQTAKDENRPSSADTNGWTQGFSMNSRPSFHEAFTDTGIKPKDLIGIPWMVAFALRADGWYLRSAAPWIKANAMPESVTDRPTTCHEYVFQFAKSEKYWFDKFAVTKLAKPDSQARLLRGVSDSNKNVNGAPGQSPHSIHQPRKNERSGNRRYDGFNDRWDQSPTPERNRRTTDTFYEGLDSEIDRLQAQLDHLRDVRENGGVLVDSEADAIRTFLVNPQPLAMAHFATFPAALVEPMILAGCPDKVCACCGAPWVRVIEHGTPVRSGGMGGNATNSAVGPMDRGGKGQWDAGAMPTTRPATTIGWQPACDCNADIRPGIILDPFMGAGTSAIVARATGRSYLGSELNPDYVKICKERLRQPFEQHHVTKESDLSSLPLFAQGA